MNSTVTKQTIRRDMRAMRAELTAAQLNDAAALMTSIVETQAPSLLNAKNVLSYEPFAGEMSPKLMTEKMPGSTIYLPKIVDYKNGIMEFLPANSELRENQFGIKEPSDGEPCRAQELDLILVPLTAFDARGNRLGMGAGFYDRALSNINTKEAKRPITVGLAHHFQKFESIPTDHWDVALDAIISDQEVIFVSGRLGAQ